jgi:rod shape-determining protein MreC
MESAFQKRRLSRFFLLGGFVGLALALLLWLRPTASIYATKLEQLCTLLMTPVGVVTGYVSLATKKVTKMFRLFSESERLEMENRQLKKRLVELENENRQLRRYMTENYRLRRMLQLEPKLPQKHLTAEVIAGSPTNWVYSALLNRGREHGVSVGDVVIAYEGLVGQVVRVANKSSIALFIVDRRCNVGVRVKRNGAIGFIKGDGDGECNIVLLTANADLKVGDEVVTSGLGGVYPAGIPVGKVIRAWKPKANQTFNGIVKPFVDFSNLREVFIISGERDSGL